MPFSLGTIYVTKDSEGFTMGTRVEFIGGPDDDCFTDGESVEYFDESEVLRSHDQTPINCNKVIQTSKARAMAGYDPE